METDLYALCNLTEGARNSGHPKEATGEVSCGTVLPRPDITLSGQMAPQLVGHVSLPLGYQEKQIKLLVSPLFSVFHCSFVDYIM